jgi:hypothetical protein
VTATSPSQTATTTTDAGGHFGFLTLGPDTYTVSASKAGHPSASVAGQVVFVDTVQTVSLKMIKARTIARVTSTAPGEYGHGVITPVQSWRKDGQDCYHGRYQFTFHDGTTESGDIVWPFCYDRSVDPFTHSAQTIPFPIPPVGFKLPADARCRRSKSGSMRIGPPLTPRRAHRRNSRAGKKNISRAPAFRNGPSSLRGARAPKTGRPCAKAQLAWARIHLTDVDRDRSRSPARSEHRCCQ